MLSACNIYITLYNYEENDIKNEIKKNSNFNKLGNCNKEKHKIHLFAEPKIMSKQYTVPFSLRSQARDHLNNLIDKNIIRKSRSPYCSPAFFIAKKGSMDLRLVIDYF
ncbi:Retrovirus-related Pol polyprotein from transposon 17.6 [Dictyocoela muelleri]|nr:Retrovirus-related Pol polyprotein from transposon 17.6 [Dictyocoela muelleri]